MVLDDGMAVKVIAQFQDIQGYFNSFFWEEVARQLFQQDVHHVVKNVLYVGVVVTKLIDPVEVGPLAFTQCLDVREDHFFLVILDMLHHLLFVFVVEMAEHGPVFISASLDDALEMIFKMRKTLIEVIAMRSFQVRKESAHINLLEFTLYRPELAVSVDLADGKEEIGTDVVHPTHLFNAFIAETQPDAKPGQQLQQAAISRQEFGEFGFFRETVFLDCHDALFRTAKIIKRMNA